MRYNKDGNPILRRLSVNSPFKLVFETFCVLGFEYEWCRGSVHPYAFCENDEQVSARSVVRRWHSFREFEELIECVNMIMEERGYIKPIEKI